MAKGIKWPRLVLFPKRHAMLEKEARRRQKAGEPNANMQAIGEEMFIKAEGVNG